jgi:hypothetical protein
MTIITPTNLKPTPGWTDFAIMEPSVTTYDKKGEPILWRVQTNDETGAWRCFCKSFIFSGRGGAIRTCKHIRHCQGVQANEAMTVAKVAPIQTMPVSTKHPQWDSAYAICSAMVDQARLIVNDKQRTAMVEVLAKKLAAFVPTRPVTPQVAVAGITRRIVFDD